MRKLNKSIKILKNTVIIFVGLNMEVNRI